MLDWIDYRILAAYTNGIATFLFFLMGIFFIRKEKGSRLKHILGYILCIWGVLLFKDILYLTGVFPHNEFVFNLLLNIDMWVTTTCVFYAMELLLPGWLNWKRIVFHLIPFVSLTLFYILFKSAFIFELMVYYALIYSFAYLSIIIYHIHLYRRAVRNQYSNLSYIDVGWLIKVLIVMLCCLGFFIYVYFQESFLVDVLYYISISLVWGFISYYTNSQYIPQIEELLPMEGDSIAVENPHFVESLKELVQSNYFCKHPQLTLTELAIVLNTNRTTLSNYLNMTLKVNFHDFVNQERIKHAEQLLIKKETQRITQEEIAELSGFNSLSTFRRAFSKRHNMSPLQYQQQHRA